MDHISFFIMKYTWLLFIVACAPAVIDTVEPDPTNLPLWERPVQELDDGTKYILHPSRIQDGGPPMDGIPSIDNPVFEIASTVDWIQDNELVLVLEYNNEVRAYPAQVMVWHEIVNDVVNGTPIAVTYCPLCGSGVAFKRVIDNEPVEFGTSGKLFNSNLVMYDRKTQTYWTQIDTLAVVGPLSRQQLEQVPLSTVVWGDWKEMHPDALVLSRHTGFDRPYGNDPYGTYYEDSNLFFPVDAENNTIHPKTPVIGVRVNGHFKAYRESDIDSITDTVNGREVFLERGNDGTISVSVEGEVPTQRNFWFSWYAFHPSTELYEK